MSEFIKIRQKINKNNSLYKIALLISCRSDEKILNDLHNDEFSSLIYLPCL